MPALKRSSLLLALLAALLAVVAPVAWAGDPDDKTERAAAEAVEPAEVADDAVDAEGSGEADAETPPKPKKQRATEPCAERDFARVFKPWHDKRLYTLAPGGDFETLAEGWTLDGGAAPAADSSPFLLGSALGASSLELPAGASAVSPPICVERGFPSFRFLARSVSEERAVIKVQVLYANGRRKATGRLKPGAEWAPTRKLSLAQGRFKVRRGHSAQIQLRFAVTAGAARLDDVYVDPRLWR